jgi:hypothetical protein
MTGSDQGQDERLNEWKRRAERPGDAAGSERAAEEHDRYERTFESDEARNGDDGTLQPEETRHETPPGADQTAG